MLWTKMETSPNPCQKYSRLKQVVEAVDGVAQSRGISPQIAIDQLQPLFEEARGILSKLVTKLEENGYQTKESQESDDDNDQGMIQVTWDRISLPNDTEIFD
jgi:F0F1-type ATP synthase gamma subunit